jgi:hypothetical protein
VAATVSGPPEVLPLETPSFTFTAFDSSPPAQAAPFTFRVDWGDGTHATLTGTSPVSATHSFGSAGAYTITVTATDKDGVTSPASTLTVTVTNALLRSGDLLVGGTAGNDSIIFTPGSNAGDLQVALNGQALGTFHPTGSVRVYGWAGSDTVVVNGRVVADSFVLNPTGILLNSLTFTGEAIEKWQANGLGGNDTFLVNGGVGPIDGGPGTDTLTGPAAANLWVLTGPGAGTLNNRSFSNMENLTGGSLADVSKVKPGGSIAGTANGGSGTDKLDYTLYGSSVTVNLQTKTATGVGHFAAVEQLQGSTAADTLSGANAANVWQLTGADAGHVGAYSFGSFENLAGGTGTDTFKLANGAGVSGSLSGGGSTNRLNYVAYTTGVVVDLGAGTATNIGAGISGIENVTGGAGNDTLTGDAGDNVLLGNAGNDVLNGGPGGNDILVGGGGDDQLTGGPGRRLLIGDDGADTLTGSGDDDLLIAGTTNYDTNTTALLAILGEWSRTDADYATRMAHLRGTTPGGTNGAVVLTSATVKDDGVSADVLSGGAGSDWFRANLRKDTITDLEAGEQVN